MKQKTIEQQIKYLDDEKEKLLEKLEKQKSKGLKYCIVRTYSAGVFAGYVFREFGKEVTLKDARRIWYWKGAATLSELAVKGTSKPNDCKFPVAVPEVRLKEVIEIIPCNNEAKKSIEGVKEWSE